MTLWVASGQAILSENACIFFKLFSTVKVNLVAKIMQSALCLIIYVKHKKLPFLAVLTWFLIFGKIQDGNHCWWCHRPPAAPPFIKYTSSCWEDQGFPLKAKSFRNTATYQKLWGGVPSTPPLLYHGSKILRVCPRVKCFFQNLAS